MGGLLNEDIEFDVHERYNDKVDGLTHEINVPMPVYATFARDHTSHTTLWHAPLEEENVGGGAVHEVACGSYKHNSRPSTSPVPLNDVCRSHVCEGRTDLFLLPSRAGRLGAPSRTVSHRSRRR